MKYLGNWQQWGRRRRSYQTVNGTSGTRLRELSGALCSLSAWALHRTIVSIAAGNTWFPWPRCPKGFKAPIPSVWAPGWQSSPAGWDGATAVRIARGGAGDAPRGSARSRERRRGSREVPAARPIGWEYFCPRSRSLLKFVIICFFCQRGRRQRYKYLWKSSFVLFRAYTPRILGADLFCGLCVTALGTKRCFGG